MPTNTELAILGYKAYSESANGLNYMGKPMPTWELLPFAVQMNWEVSAIVIKKALQFDCQAFTPSETPSDRSQNPPRHIYIVATSEKGQSVTGADYRFYDSITNKLDADVQSFAMAVTFDDQSTEVQLLRIDMEHYATLKDPTLADLHEFTEVVILDSISVSFSSASTLPGEL